jgi:hypothetical protein
VEKKKKIKIMILIGTVLLGVGVGLLVFKLKGDTVPATETDSDTFPIAAFIPIWFSAIPAVAANKEKDELGEKEKKLLIFFTAAAVLMLIVSILYLILG